jgi:hypothetical protein
MKQRINSPESKIMQIPTGALVLASLALLSTIVVSSEQFQQVEDTVVSVATQLFRGLSAIEG